MTPTLSPDVTATTVDGGMVLLDERDGRYWHLNQTGATTLSLILEGRSPEEVAARLAQDQPEAVQRARDDVARLLAGLRDAGLVVMP
jgi:hypothetical protein